jgi:hypothetical protein
MTYRIAPPGFGSSSPSAQPVAPAGTADYPAPDALYWFDGNSNDNSLNSYDLTSTSGLFWSPFGLVPRNPTLGYEGLCFWSDDFGTPPNASRTNVDTLPFRTAGDVTICAFVNPTEPNETLHGVISCQATTLAWRCWTDFTVNGMVPGFGYEVAAATHFVACPHAILMDAWTFVIWRRTVNVGVDTDIDFFLNGEKYSVAGEPLGDAQAGATPTIRALRGSSSSNEVDGGVGQVGVWLSALTDAECIALAASVAPCFLT